MIDRRLFTPNGDDPPCPVPVNDLCTVPTAGMAHLMADLVVNGKQDADILEIGTGSGYQAAVLAERCKTVVTIDIVRQPGVDELLPKNVFVMHANGYEYDTHEKYDGVLVTFRANRLSGSWLNQLKEGGRLVVPMVCGEQARITIYVRRSNELELVDVIGYANFTEGFEA